MDTPIVSSERLRELSQRATRLLAKRVGCGCCRTVAATHECGEGHKHPTVVFVHADVHAALEAVAQGFDWTPFLLDPLEAVTPKLNALQVVEAYVGHSLTFVVLADEEDSRLRSLVIFPRHALRPHADHPRSLDAAHQHLPIQVEAPPRPQNPEGYA